MQFITNQNAVLPKRDHKVHFHPYETPMLVPINSRPPTLVPRSGISTIAE